MLTAYNRYIVYCNMSLYVPPTLLGGSPWSTGGSSMHVGRRRKSIPQPWRINIQIHTEWIFLYVRIYCSYIAVSWIINWLLVSSLVIYCFSWQAENSPEKTRSTHNSTRNTENKLIPRVCVLLRNNHDSTFKPTTADNLHSSLVISWLIATL